MTVTESGKIWTREKVIDHIEKALTVKRIPDFSGEDLSDLDLSLIDFNRANLYSANLSGSDLSYTTLAGCTLDFTDLRDTDLKLANLTDARMYAATFGKADLTGANLAGCDLSVADFLDATLKAAVLAPTRGAHLVLNTNALGYCVVMPTWQGWKIHVWRSPGERYYCMSLDEFCVRAGESVNKPKNECEVAMQETLVKLITAHCEYAAVAVVNLDDMMAENHGA